MAAAELRDSWTRFMAEVPVSKRARRLGVILGGDILTGIVGHERRRDETDHRAGGDEDRNCVARVVNGEQRGRDDRSRAAGDDRRKLIAER